uniref:Anthocyanidin 3-O-glucosyltransferase n=1 Tax=Gentiana triflora TaxID=55190 RepID=UFOG_GENTR|nr:RecName: Full=Anthocyanidin 3-O-glucosyltransferase; AltName: Full=Flavonol 3-O-glucosyltransferase; AltName: Full=UDP-glucose flavonoid 3-O-glucosyltransferase [Gentiana triflora]BAA12737.1 UDP-glucose:flavonoid-3-glucosyltransferase [Gentiana triflora]
MSPVSHVAVLAFPFGTHAAPLLTLVNRLAASAPDIIFSFFSTSSSITTIFSPTNLISIGSNIKPYAVWDGSPEGFVFSGNPREPIEYFLNAAPDNFDKAMKKAVEDTGVNISCLLTDAFLWFAADFSEKIGVPWIPVWTAASCSLCLHVYTDEIRSRFAEFDIAEKAEKTIDFIPGLSAISFSDLPEELIMEDSQSIFALTLHNMGLKLHKATAVAVNSFEEIDPIITNHLRSTNQLNILNIGPLQTLSSSIPPEDNECLKWLQTQKESSVVYLSFGTVINPPPNEMAALASTLESRKIPFLWSLRDEARKHLPENFIDRTSTFGKIVSWAPQLHVLENPAIGVFVTHCGWNSTLESIFCRVPVIGRPFFGDQKVNARMVEDVWKIGVGVKGGVFTEDETTRVLELVLFSDKGKEMRQNVGRLKEKAKDAVKANGSSTRNFESLLAAFNKLDS